MLLVVCWMTHKSTWWCWFFVWSQIFVAVVVIDVIDDHNHVADDDDDNEDGDAGDGGCGGVDDGGIFGDGAGGNDTYDDDDDNNIRDTFKRSYLHVKKRSPIHPLNKSRTLRIIHTRLTLPLVRLFPLVGSLFYCHFE